MFFIAGMFKRLDGDNKILAIDTLYPSLPSSQNLFDLPSSILDSVINTYRPWHKEEGWFPKADAMQYLARLQTMAQWETRSEDNYPLSQLPKEVRENTNYAKVYLAGDNSKPSENLYIKNNISFGIASGPSRLLAEKAKEMNSKAVTLRHEESASYISLVPIVNTIVFCRSHNDCLMAEENGEQELHSPENSFWKTIEREYKIDIFDRSFGPSDFFRAASSSRFRAWSRSYH